MTRRESRGGTISPQGMAAERGRAARESPPSPWAARAVGARGLGARVPCAGRCPGRPGRSRRPDTQGRPLPTPGRCPATRERRAGAALTAAPAGCVLRGLRCLCWSPPPWQGQTLHPDRGRRPAPPRPRLGKSPPSRPVPAREGPALQPRPRAGRPGPAAPPRPRQPRPRPAPAPAAPPPPASAPAAPPPLGKARPRRRAPPRPWQPRPPPRPRAGSPAGLESAPAAATPTPRPPAEVCVGRRGCWAPGAAGAAGPELRAFPWLPGGRGLAV